MKSAAKTNRRTPARTSAAKAMPMVEDALAGANASKAQPEMSEGFLQTPDEEIQKMDEVIREARAKWYADHPTRERTMEELRAELFHLAKQLLSRHLRELARSGSVYASEWHIKTLMCRSGVVAHSPEANSRVFEVCPEWVVGDWRDTLDKLLGQPDSEGKPCIRYTGERAASLVAEAVKGDPPAWEASRRLAVCMIEQGDPLPTELRAFAVDILSGAITKPIRKGRKKEALRNAAIQSTVSLLEEHFGFPKFFSRTRNADRKRTTKASICDAMANALGTLGERISYDAVVKIVASLPPPRKLDP